MSPTTDEPFYTFKSGPLTIIGFTATEILRPEKIKECRDRLVQLIKDRQCQELIVDLYEMPIISSWILGLLAFIRTQGVKVHLYHPSEAIQDVLQATRLDQLLETRGTASSPSNKIDLS